MGSLGSRRILGTPNYCQGLHSRLGWTLVLVLAVAVAVAVMNMYFRTFSLRLVIQSAVKDETKPQPSVCLVIITAGRDDLLNRTVTSINQTVSNGLGRFSRRIILDDSRNSTVQQDLIRKYPMFRIFRTNYTKPSDRETRISRNFWLMYVLAAPKSLNPDYKTFLGPDEKDKCPAVEVQSGEASVGEGGECLWNPRALWQTSSAHQECEYVLHSEEDWLFNNIGFLDRLVDAHQEIETAINKAVGRGREDGATINCLTEPGEGGVIYNRTTLNLVGISLTPEAARQNTCSVSGGQTHSKWFLLNDKTDKDGWRHWTNRPSLVRPSLVLANTTDYDWGISEGKRAGTFYSRHWTLVYLNSVGQTAALTHLGGGKSTKFKSFGEGHIRLR